MTAERVVQLLDAADALPQDLAEWLVEGFTAWQAGADLAEALGLPASLHDRRDDLVRLVLEVSPGDTDTARCLYLLECLDGAQHIDTIGRQFVAKLQALPLPVPRSVRQLTNILNNDRSGTRKKTTNLFPSWPLVQDSDTDNCHGGKNEYPGSAKTR